MRTVLVRLLLAAAAITPQQASAQSTDTRDVVIFRRDLPVERIVRPITDTLAQLLIGDTYGWYPYCTDGASTAMCFSFPDDGGQPDIAPNDNCLKAQNDLHTAHLRSQSIRYTGSATFFDKAGQPARTLTCAPEHIGYGFKCIGSAPYGPYFVCGKVDKEGFILQGANTSDCTKDNGPGFEKVLDVFGLQPARAGLDTTEVCKNEQSFFGRTESCSWSQSQDGSRSLKVIEKCYSVNPTTASVTEVALRSCSNFIQTETPAIAAARTAAKLLAPTAAPVISCGQSDEGRLTSKIVNDTTRTLPGDKLQRTVSYTYSCSLSGLPTSISKCAAAYAAWTSETSRFATENMLNLEVVNGIGTRVETYTEQ